LVRVLTSFDPEQRYVRVDFPAEIRKLIKPDEQTATPWLVEGGDYLIFVTRRDLDDGFEFVEGAL
jgi:hypothetical protein